MWMETQNVAGALGTTILNQRRRALSRVCECKDDRAGLCDLPIDLHKADFR